MDQSNVDVQEQEPSNIENKKPMSAAAIQKKKKAARQKAKREQAKIDAITAAATAGSMTEKKSDPVADGKINDDICKMANQLWQYIVENNTKPDLKMLWKQLNDQDRLDLVNMKFRDFVNKYPVVSKYMVLANQYSEKAFRRFLIKCSENTPNIQGVGIRDKDKMAEMKKISQIKWCENNAWYGVYLWEAYVKASQPNKRFERREQRSVYRKCYEPLIAEFEQMDEMKKDAEITMKEMRELTDKQSVDDVMAILRDGAYKNLGAAEKTELLLLLRDLQKKKAISDQT